MIWTIAHRGYHARCVENTLEAFASAYGLGCDMVEFDVQLSRDGIPVIFHDDDLRRMAGRPDSVFDLDAEELVNIPLRDPKTMALGRMPTLREFLAQFGSRPFYLEMKVPNAKAGIAPYWKNLVEQSVKLLGRGHAQSFVASFHLDAVRHALADCGFARSAAIHENLKTLRLAVEAEDSDPLARRLFDSISYPVFRQAGKSALALDPDRILLWHVEGAAQFTAAREAGVAGVVADDVPALLAAIQNKA